MGGRPEGGLKLWRELPDPAVNVGMVNLNVALAASFLQVPVAERIGEVPADTKQDNVLLEAVTFEVDHRGRSKRCWLGA